MYAQAEGPGWVRRTRGREEGEGRAGRGEGGAGVQGVAGRGEGQRKMGQRGFHLGRPTATTMMAWWIRVPFATARSGALSCRQLIGATDAIDAM